MYFPRSTRSGPYAVSFSRDMPDDQVLNLEPAKTRKQQSTNASDTELCCKDQQQRQSDVVNYDMLETSGKQAMAEFS